MSEWLTVPEVAKELGVSDVQAWRLVRKGRVPAQRVGRQWMVSRLNLEKAKAYRSVMEQMLKLPFGRMPGENSEEQV